MSSTCKISSKHRLKKCISRYQTSIWSWNMESFWVKNANGSVITCKFYFICPCILLFGRDASRAKNVACLKTSEGLSRFLAPTLCNASIWKLSSCVLLLLLLVVVPSQNNFLLFLLLLPARPQPALQPARLHTYLYRDSKRCSWFGQGTLTPLYL